MLLNLSREGFYKNPRGFFRPSFRVNSAGDFFWPFSLKKNRRKNTCRNPQQIKIRILEFRGQCMASRLELSQLEMFANPAALIWFILKSDAEIQSRVGGASRLHISCPELKPK